MDQWINFLTSLFPWMSLVAGLAGSLHCVGMCGGLVAASCQKQSDIGKYQIGRLIGYLLLGGLAAYIGSTFKDVIAHPILSYLPSIMVGGLFIYWGISHLMGFKTSNFFSKILGKSYQQLWQKIKIIQWGAKRSFLVGLISILLPCGLLYGVILGTLAIQNVPLGLFSIFFFWMGTLPAMVLAPEIFRKLISPFQQHKPKLFAVSLMFLGVMTISYRFYLQSKSPDNSCGCRTFDT